MGCEMLDNVLYFHSPCQSLHRTKSSVFSSVGLAPPAAAHSFRVATKMHGEEIPVPSRPVPVPTRPRPVPSPPVPSLPPAPSFPAPRFAAELSVSCSGEANYAERLTKVY